MSRGHETSAVVSALEQYFQACAHPGLVAAYLFGSHARDAAHMESDVDVAIILSRDIYPNTRERFEQRVRVASNLVDLLNHNEVDVVVLNDAPPLFARHVVTQGRQVFCADRDRARDFVRDVQLRAADLEPFLRRTRRIKLESLAR